MTNSGWGRTESPFHAGEIAIQTRLGIQDRMDRQGRRIIREYLTEQHQKFFARLAYAIVGIVDEFDRPWTSILIGKPGFLSTPSDRLLKVVAKPLPGDPLKDNLTVGNDIGLLGIELHSRRRNRLNGIISSSDRNSFEVTVSQSFGNCPQYIQARTFEFVETSNSVSPQIKEINSFGESENNLIANADTFFITSAYQKESAGIAKGIDVSHRGGKPGFVRIDGEKTLTVPDFSGNNHFNTLGNIELNPSVGLLFLDFMWGDVLYLTGTAEVIWSGREISTYAGAQQLIRFDLQKGYLAKTSLPLCWTTPDFSPFLKDTGSWK
ncbi:pyridoxamine 5'-phosphate oxidase family protein [Waterburya agarophytonicola K14]|uniref:Pyridoxamine 5'-phosphate oxidase family protein n=1 Tax=Waterburya agarophytonicola KI4 TaxID=2874699 RepID=A0A964BQ80_9CYAN|nr:pyridoxamine 5'-phosphate oxidase family protein [Waterburya agarophytonicola]MCC0176796.1 pyridoxamine 5'-phosphate oxidase family protein [Waterburya agarophytonicola KI4]